MLKYRKGEATTVVVIILVLALIGALGFIAWQNLSKKETPSNTDTTQQTSDEQIVKFPDWGVEMTAPESAYGLAVEEISPTPEMTTAPEGMYSVTIPDAILLGKVTTPDAKHEIGRITRYKAAAPASEAFMDGDANKTVARVIKDDDKLRAAVVGDYAYIFTSIQNGPFMGDGEEVQAANKKASDIISGAIPVAMQSMRASK